MVVTFVMPRYVTLTGELIVADDFCSFSDPDCNRDAEDDVDAAPEVGVGAPAYVFVTTETKRFICSDCGKDFVTTQALKRHQRTVHSPNLERIPCTICDAKFTRVDGIKKHMRKFHPDVEFNPLRAEKELLGGDAADDGDDGGLIDRPTLPIPELLAADSADETGVDTTDD